MTKTADKIFDIDTADELFAMLRERFDQYCYDPEKSTEDAIFIVLIANHLREWIAPGYGPKGKKWPVAKTEAQKFSQRVYSDKNFEVVRAIANGTKHLRTGPKTSVSYTGHSGHQPEQDVAIIGHIAGRPILKGIPEGHYADGTNLKDIIAPVVALYREWFEP